MATPATAERVRRSLTGTLGPAWFVDQRWFRAKRRLIVSLALNDLVSLDNRDAWLAVVGVRYATNPEDRYLLPLFARGTEVREPRDGDGVWRSLARLMLGGGELVGVRGVFEFHPAPGGPELARGTEGHGGAEGRGGADLATRSERRLGVEQSNTSVVIGERLVLKLYRLHEPGENPEVEMGGFLSAAGFADAPALAGSATYRSDDGAAGAVAILQAYVSNQGDGWTWALRGLSRTGGPDMVLAGMATIGSLTARMHAALASRPDDPAFPARQAAPAERAAWRARAEQQLERAIAVLAGPERRRLEAIAPAIRRRMAPLAMGGAAPTSRIHGDYHLGQLLRTEHGFSVIDFEGEPARPLSERRRPSSPLRDLAGMLRSVDYAARTSQRAGTLSSFDADAWLMAARDTFRRAYGSIDPDDDARLVGFELEKACYEVHYETSNRPDWTWLPLDALERLIG